MNKIRIYYDEAPGPSETSCQIKKLDNLSYDFKKPFPVIRQNINYSAFSPIMNKNGCLDNKIKNDLNLLNTFVNKSNEKNNYFDFIRNNNLNYKIDQNFSQIMTKNDTNLKENYLEPKINIFNELGDFIKIPDFQKNLYNTTANYKLNEEHLLKCPLISRLFTPKINMVNNYIYSSPKKIIILDKNSKSLESSPSKSKIQINTSENNSPNIINSNNKIKVNLENEKINFNIPDNFLIDFNIKEIHITDFQKKENQTKITDYISLKDSELFLNSLCKNLISYKNNEFISSLKEEYIEFKKISNEEEKNIFFLQKKLVINLDYEEIVNINNLTGNSINNSKRKKYPLKIKNKHKKINKKLKSKIILLNKKNNKKDGEKIHLYLNEIQINKNSLENFPFFPTLNMEENINIEFLKAIIDKKELIRLNKKAELIKDKRNEKYIKNRRFEFIYQNNEKTEQYSLYINECHILYLFLYYYYQIKEGIKLINKFHYSHSSFYKSQRVANLIEKLIKRCNSIVKEITK